MVFDLLDTETIDIDASNLENYNWYLWTYSF